ncbi:MAG TPA: DEAD/DEAH box helicase [Candidatus Paceibacterota bacterium]|nr:DEAD/DEAH box helicase [Candidatus Paceibacterota bacterium]
MQIGRWNHQGTGSSSFSGQGGSSSRGRSRRGGGRAYRGREEFSRPYSPRPAAGRGSFRQARSPRRGGRGGFGAFGQTEAEIARFVNRAVTTTEESSGPYIPEHAFSDFMVDERLKANVARKGYETPTPIQDKAIPHVLLGQDVVGLAETGTGKTAAFLIPLIDKVLKHPEERVLVMAPTRELAVQIEKELAGFARGLGFRGMVAVGGANINPQIAALKHKPSFVIGTPGRLKDLMERGALDLSAFQSVVLDEADRMLDMGFIDDMRFILGKMNPVRHTLFFSATMGKEIEHLVNDFLKEPVRISVKQRDTSKNVDQDVVRIPPGKDKFDVLVELLGDKEFNKVLIFVRTKHGAERLAKMLSRQRLFAESIHGNKTHNARLRALEAFKRGQVQALVATDVAARGLDIPAVSHVINYDLPSTYEDYVHRIGRTGRAEAKGKALTFVQ